MTTNPDQTPTETPTADFEAALRTLVLESFAQGAAIQGTWEITPSASVVPAWRVTIEKTDAAEPPQDHSVFLDE